MKHKCLLPILAAALAVGQPAFSDEAPAQPAPMQQQPVEVAYESYGAASTDGTSVGLGVAAVGLVIAAVAVAVAIHHTHSGGHHHHHHAHS
jgi:hypothetical protein